MRVEQAVYGEIRNAHGLRQASGDHELAAAVAARMDLPDNAPPGVSWSPYVSGFAWRDNYVIARTFLDDRAPRAGMVLTHALFAPLSEVVEFESLAPMLNKLTTTFDPTINIAAFDLQSSGVNEATAPDLVAAANALTSPGSGPVVRIGSAGFERLVSCLWANLPPHMRKTFSFRLSFGTKDLAAEVATPTIVCTPEQLRAPWSRSRVVNPEDREPNSLAAAALAGHPSAAPLKDFIGRFGVDIAKLSDLSIAERAEAVMTDGAGFEDLLTAARLVERLSPTPKKGALAKADLLQRLVTATGQASPANLALLKNLSLSGFANSNDLWEAVEQRLANRDFPAANDAVEIDLVMSANDEELALPAWRAAAVAAFEAAARRAGSKLPAAVWRWAEPSPAAFATAVQLLPREAVVEQRLAEAAPKVLNPNSLDALLRPLVARRWLTAHGATLSAALVPIEAVRRQLEVDQDAARPDGLKFALRLATPLERVTSALTFEDPRLTDLAVEAAIRQPNVLRDLDFGELVAQSIWSKTLSAKPTAWDAPTSPTAARDQVLASLQANRQVDHDLLDALSRTPLADLSTSPDRQALWARLPAGARERFLKATAQAWVDAATSGPSAPMAETELQAAVVTMPSLDDVLQSRSTTSAAALAIIAALRQFDERRFITWLHATLLAHSNLSATDAQTMGHLMLERRWRSAVRELASKYGRRRRDVQPALIVCSSEFTSWERWLFGVQVPSSDDKWRAFIDEAANLYPSGPDHHELWSRAGGNNSKLPRGHNGLARWQALGWELRNGRFPGAVALLSVMRGDFPHNEALQVFASDTDIVKRP